MSEIIDIAPNGEQIYYDPTGRAMMNVNGQLVYTPQYDRVAQQPVQQAYAPAVQQAYAPAAQQPQQAGGMLAFFTGGVGTETSNLPSYMLGADHTSMDGQDSTMVDTIRLDKRGDFIVNMSGVALPGQRTLDVVILGCGPTGGRSTVYRTFFEGVYNENADAEQKKPVCWSYDNVAPAPNAPARQHVTCQGCPMDVKGSGPNNTRRCGKSQYLMVALASDLTKAYRLKISSKGIYATEVAKNEYGLKPYATLLKSKQANWEGMVTTMHCPDGLSGGIRFLPNRFLTEQEYKQAQELKMNLDVSLYINLDADQDNVTVKLGETVVGQVPTEQLGNVVQHVQQAVTQAVAQVQTQAQPVVQQAAPVAQPVAQPVTAPLSFKDGLRAHPAFATLPQNVVDYVMHPGVDDATAQQYLAQYFPQVLAPVQPVAAPVAPVSPVVTAPVQPAVTQAAAVQPSPAVSAPVAQPQQPAVSQAPAAHAPVQHAQPVAQASAPADFVMPAQPAEPTMPTEPAAAPQPAQTTTNAVGVQQAQNVNDLLAMI
nr:MAG TPA_asm: Thioredoxin reductase [Caudoviricetes sp.]